MEEITTSDLQIKTAETVYWLGKTDDDNKGKWKGMCVCVQEITQYI